MLDIRWPKKWLPGFTDNFVSNEVIVKDLSFNKVLNNLLDINQWEKYYSNSKDAKSLNQESTYLKLNTEFKFITFGFDIFAKVVELEINLDKKTARIAWEAWNEDNGNNHLEAYHAWIIEEIEYNRLRILTQETQIGEPARKLAMNEKFPMLNGHQLWLNGLVDFSK